MKTNKRYIGVFLVVWALAYLLSYRLGAANVSFIDLFISIIGILAGLIIGGIGVFLGGIGNLFALVEFKQKNSAKNLSAFVDAMNNTIKELEDNMMFTLWAFGVGLLLALFGRIDFPYITWPLNPDYFPKSAVFLSITLTIVAAIFLALNDSLKAIFRLHRLYTEILREKLKNETSL